MKRRQWRGVNRTFHWLRDGFPLPNTSQAVGLPRVSPFMLSALPGEYQGAQESEAAASRSSLSVCRSRRGRAAPRPSATEQFANFGADVCVLHQRLTHQDGLGAALRQSLDVRSEEHTSELQSLR